MVVGSKQTKESSCAGSGEVCGSLGRCKAATKNGDHLPGCKAHLGNAPYAHRAGIPTEVGRANHQRVSSGQIYGTVRASSIAHGDDRRYSGHGGSRRLPNVKRSTAHWSRAGFSPQFQANKRERSRAQQRCNDFGMHNSAATTSAFGVQRGAPLLRVASVARTGQVLGPRAALSLVTLSRRTPPRGAPRPAVRAPPPYRPLG